MSKEQLYKISTGKKSTWADKARDRVKNKKWLTYSSQIARRILAEIRENKDLKQKDIAVALGVSPQYVSQIIKGRENLTLEGIAKISEALGVELITFPEYKYSVPAIELAHEFIVLVSLDSQMDYVVKPNKEILNHFSTDVSNSETGGSYIPNIQVSGCVSMPKVYPLNA